MTARTLIVLPVIDRYGASQTGLGLVEKFLENGFEVTLWCPRGKHESHLTEGIRQKWKNYLTIEEVEFPVLRREEMYRLNIFRTIATLYRKLYRLRRRLKTSDTSFDSVHFLTLATLLGLFLPKRRSHFAFSIHETPRNFLERIFSQHIIKLRADVIIACSEYVASCFPKIAPIVIYSGINIDRFKVSPSEQKLQLGVPLNALCVGRINSWKGQDLLIKAISLVNADKVKVKVTFAGASFSGDEKTMQLLLQLVVDLEAESYVKFLGEVAQIEKTLPEFDICCVPSKVPEPFGMVVIEGMAAGRILVASDQGGPAEVIKHKRNGLLFRMGDANDLADQFFWVIENIELARKLGLQASIDADSYSESNTRDTYFKHLTAPILKARR